MVKKIREDLAMGLSGPELQVRPKKLTNYEDLIKGLVKKGLSAQFHF